MFRSLILSVATIGTLAIGSAAPANAYVPCSPYVGGMCGPDTEIGLGAMVYHMVGPGGIFAPRQFGGGYAYGGYYGHPYGYMPSRPVMVYHPPQAWCVYKPTGMIIHPGACENGY